MMTCGIVETVDYERYDGSVGKVEILEHDFIPDLLDIGSTDYALAVVIPSGEFVVIFNDGDEVNGDEWVESVMSSSLLDGEF